MKSSWRQTFRRLAAGCVISGSVAWSSAMCYAVQLAHDSASDPVYASGWAAGQNGGFGFTTGWDFDTGYWWPYDQVFYPYANQAEAHQIDDGLKSGTQFSNPFNDIGSPAINGNKRTWTIARRDTPETEGVPRAGRGISPLQPGQTISVVVDTPNHLPPFNGGFWVSLNSNSQAINGATGIHGNICQGGRPCYYIPDTRPGREGKWWKGADPKEALSVMNWNYNGGFGFGYGKVFGPDGFTGLFSYDAGGGFPENTSDGMKIDVTMVTPTTFNLAIWLLGDSDPEVPDYTLMNGTFANAVDNLGNPRPIDWIQFSHVYNFSDEGTPPTVGTDFYIRSITISDATAPGLPGDFNNDQKVDAADYVVWRKNNGTSNALPNDNGLGVPVNSNHYNLWRNNFGEMAGGGSGGQNDGGAVPEPGTFVYLVVAAMGSLAVGARRRP